MPIYCLIILLFLGQLVFGQFSQAQMYQWVDPETGTTQLSGKPPFWYRNAPDGPRVFVFERGRVIDDTSIVISDKQSRILRSKALNRVAEKKLIAEEIAQPLQASTRQDNEDTLSVDQPQEQVTIEPSAPEGDSGKKNISADKPLASPAEKN